MKRKNKFITMPLSTPSFRFPQCLYAGYHDAHAAYFSVASRHGDGHDIEYTSLDDFIADSLLSREII